MLERKGWSQPFAVSNSKEKTSDAEFEHCPAKGCEFVTNSVIKRGWVSA